MHKYVEILICIGPAMALVDGLDVDRWWQEQEVRSEKHDPCMPLASFPLHLTFRL